MGSLGSSFQHPMNPTGLQDVPEPTHFKPSSPTFFLTSDMTPIRVSTCWRDSPSLGTPSAKVSAPSAPGSHKCLMKRETYALWKGRKPEPSLGITAELVTEQDKSQSQDRAPSACPGSPVPELLLALPSQVPHQPVGVEGVLGRHPPAHDGVQESLALAGVEAKNLQGQRHHWDHSMASVACGTSEPHGCCRKAGPGLMCQRLSTEHSRAAP